MYALSQKSVPMKEIDRKIIQETKPKGLEDVAYEAARCDYLPPEYITFLITDLGVLAPSSVSDELIKLYSSSVCHKQVYF